MKWERIHQRNLSGGRFGWAGALLLGLLLPSNVAGVRGEELPYAEVAAFFDSYCVDCHGAADEDPEGGIALSADWKTVALSRSGPALKRALEAIEDRHMPPADMAQPADAERAQASRWVRALLARPELGPHRDPGRPILRRLTRLEYNNTVRDLLGLETDVLMFSERLPFDKSYLDPAADRMPRRLQMAAREYGAKYPVLLPDASLPADSRAAHGFANRGEAQNLSAVGLEQYLRVAREIAFHPELLSRGERLQELFPGARFRSAGSQRSGAGNPAAVVTAGDRLAANGNLTRTAEGSADSLVQFQQRLAQAFPEDRGGVFDAEQNKNTTVAGKGGLLRVAYGKNANRILAVNPNEDLWIAPFATAEETSGDCLFCNRRKGQKQFVLTFQRGGDQPWKGVQHLGVVLLSRQDQAGTVRLTAEFADGGSVSLTVSLRAGAGADNTFVSFSATEGTAIERLAIDGSKFSGDYVLCDDLVFITHDAPSGDAAVVGRELPSEIDAETSQAGQDREPDSTRYRLDPSLAGKDAATRLAHLLRLAFRRPVAASEVRPYLHLYASAMADGADDEQAMRTVLAAVLCSPSFLYLAESRTAVGDDAAAEGRVVPLTDYELASRLSYFLWCSMPDDELFALAESGQLGDPVVLESQVRRMLRDPRIRELSEDFFVQWMRLRELWSVRPDARQFRAFYSGPLGKRTLARDMFGEVLLLFETILLEDRSILELVQADFSYLNGKLIELYGFEPETVQLADSAIRLTAAHVEDDRLWYRVALPDATRGGVLTSAAAMTLTSFPHRTSPIRRGAWFLETIYNRPPPPPTIAVADIDDQQGVQDLSLREKVELHRAKAACAVCHDRIDPPGFALENFDAIGRWRDREQDRPIDAGGEIPGVGTYANPGEFKALLIEQKQRFARGFAEHLISYALGRELKYYDTATVEAIVAAAAKDEYRLSRFVLEIVKSDAFQRKTVRENDARTARTRRRG